MAKSRREKRKRQKVSASRRLREHKSGVSFTCFSIPEGVELLKVDKGGLKRFDIVPFVAGKGNPFADEGMDHYERTYWAHRGIGPNNASYVCPAKVLGKRCPICEYRSQLDRDNKEEAELFKTLAPKERQLWLIVDLDAPQKGAQMLDMSYHLFGKAIDDQIENSDEEDGYQYFADVDDGLTLKVGFDQNTFAGRSYYEAVSVDFRPRKANYDENFLSKLPCLDDLLIVESYEKLQAIFLGDDDLGHTTENEDYAAPRSRKRKETNDVVDDDEGFEDDDDGNDPDLVAEEAAEEEEEELTIPDGMVACIACQGSGTSTSGRRCRGCKGEGFVDAPEEDDEEEAPKPKARRSKTKSKASSKVSEEADVLPFDDDDDDDDDWDADDDWDED